MEEGAIAAAKVEWQNFVNGMQRIIATEGFDVQELKGDIIDPTAAFNVEISMISGKTGIPKRVLLGSERGDLASTQDEANWLGRIAERQEQFVEPRILRAFIDRLIAIHALSAPKGGTYQVEWPNLFYLNDLERAKVHIQNTAAIRNIVGKDGNPLSYFTLEELRATIDLGPQQETRRG